MPEQYHHGDRIEHVLVPGFVMQVLDTRPCETPDHLAYKILDPASRTGSALTTCALAERRQVMPDRMVITATLGGSTYVRHAPGDEVLWPGPNGLVPGEFLSAAEQGLGWVRHDNGDTLVELAKIRPDERSLLMNGDIPNSVAPVVYDEDRNWSCPRRTTNPTSRARCAAPKEARADELA